MFKYEAQKNVVRDSRGMSIGWMDAYVYAADLYCEDCGLKIQENLADDAQEDDSDSYPQGPYPDGGGESDSPQHCGSGEGCLNAMTFVGTKVGVWLGNPLMTDGVAYLKEMLSNPNPSAYQLALHEFWSDVYSDYLSGSGGELEEGGNTDLLAFNTTLAKLMQRLKKDAGAESISQNYRGTGSQAFRRQLWVRFKSGAVIDLWLDNGRLGFGGVVMNRPPGNAPGVLPKSLPYGDKSPEQVYAEAAELLKVWATPDMSGAREMLGVREHGILATAKWVRPSHAEMFANGKPIVVTKMGRKYTVHVMGNPVTRDAEGKLTFVGRPGAVPGPAAEFKTRDEAYGIAHRIGHYMLGLGDFVDTYVEYRSAGGAGGMREQPEPVNDPFYMIQGLYNGTEAYGAGDSFGYDDEAVALDEAKKLLRAPWFEGDYVRVITRDGELVWDSRGGEPSGYGTWLLPPELNESHRHGMRMIKGYHVVDPHGVTLHFDQGYAFPTKAEAQAAVDSLANPDSVRIEPHTWSEFSIENWKQRGFKLAPNLGEAHRIARETSQHHGVQSGIGDSQRNPGDVEFRLVIRGIKPMRLWAPNIEKARRIAGATAASYRSEVVSVDPVGTTFEQWLAAAQQGSPYARIRDDEVSRKAFADGMDPAEFPEFYRRRQLRSPTRVKETHGVREKGVLEDRATNTAIRIWMKANANEFTDPRTGELNTTALVEAWDIEYADGHTTLDPNHPAWDIANEFAGYQSVHERSVREHNEPQYVPPSLAREGITPIMLEVLLHGTGSHASGKIPRSGDSVVYDRDGYGPLVASGYIVLKRGTPGTSSFSDYFVLTEKGAELERQYRLAMQGLFPQPMPSPPKYRRRRKAR